MTRFTAVIHGGWGDGVAYPALRSLIPYEREVCTPFIVLGKPSRLFYRYRIQNRNCLHLLVVPLSNEQSGGVLFYPLALLELGTTSFDIFWRTWYTRNIFGHADILLSEKSVKARNDKRSTPLRNNYYYYREKGIYTIIGQALMLARIQLHLFPSLVSLSYHIGTTLAVTNCKVTAVLFHVTHNAVPVQSILAFIYIHIPGTTQYIEIPFGGNERTPSRLKEFVNSTQWHGAYIIRQNVNILLLCPYLEGTLGNSYQVLIPKRPKILTVKIILNKLAQILEGR